MFTCLLSPFSFLHVSAPQNLLYSSPLDKSVVIFAIYLLLLLSKSTRHTVSVPFLHSCIYVFKYKDQYVVIELFVTELAGTLHVTLISSCQPPDGVRAIGSIEFLAERNKVTGKKFPVCSIFVSRVALSNSSMIQSTCIILKCFHNHNENAKIRCVFHLTQISQRVSF